ncbi:MAG: tetratricopeptide repeat protein [Planctomycetota bacterium]|nr:tetratricopeptide repeat protein [Planctomycetota bacterium]
MARICWMFVFFVFVWSVTLWVYAGDVEKTRVVERRILPLPFMNRGKAEENWLGYALCDSVHFKCGRALKEDVQIVFYDYEQVLAVLSELLLLRSDLTEARHIRRVAARFGATHVVTGEYSSKDGKVSIKIFLYGYSPKDDSLQKLKEASVEGSISSLENLLVSVSENLLILLDFSRKFSLEGLVLKDASLYVEYAKVLLNKRDPDCYEKAMDILGRLHEKSKEAAVLYQLGWFSVQKALSMEDESQMKLFFDVAKKLFRAAGESDSSFARAFNSLGMILLAENNFAEAEVQFAKASKADKKLSDCYYNLGSLYLKIRKYEKAVESLKTAYSLKPGDSAIANSLGCAYFEMEKQGEAEEWYKKAVELNRDCKEAHMGLGLLYDEKGEKEKAAEHYGRYVELGGEDEGIVARLEQLRREILRGEKKEK